MKLGAYTACLHDKPVAEAVHPARPRPGQRRDQLGRVPAPVHLPVDDIRTSQDARDEYLGLFSSAGVTLTALNCNGNPLDPNPEVGPDHAQDVRDSIELAALLGVKRVVTMSGLPGSDPGGRYPSWTVEPWHSVFLDARDYQWNEVIPFWKDIQAGRPTPTSRSASRCTPTTWSTTRPPWSGWPPRSTPPTSAPRWTPATCSGRASTRSWPPSTSAAWSTTPPPRTPASTRRPSSTGCSTTASGRSPPTPPTPCPSAAPTP